MLSACLVRVGRFMNKKNVLKVVTVLSLSLILSPAIAFDDIDAPPMSLGSKQVTKGHSDQNVAVNPLYPQKYTPSYIASIKDEYKCVGKDEVFYVALDMLKGTNGDFFKRSCFRQQLD